MNMIFNRIKNKKEHILALKISFFLVLFVIITFYIFKIENIKMEEEKNERIKILREEIRLEKLEKNIFLPKTKKQKPLEPKKIKLEIMDKEIDENTKTIVDLIKWWKVYIFLLFFTIFIYVTSYILSKLTIKPIEEYNEKLKEYNHNIAHELKTPLSVIKTELELLKLWYDKDLINSSLDELKYMDEITNSLLFLSENSKINFKNIDLVWLIEKEILKFKTLNNETNIILNNLAKNRFIQWDEALISSLVKNLVSNSIKYWTNWKPITITINKNNLIIENFHNWMIKNKDSEKLIEPFYQFDSSRNNEGYWLWLSISNKIVNIHWYKLKIDINKYIFKVSIVLNR